MSVSYDLVGIPSSVTRIDIPLIDQSKIVPAGDDVQVAKNGVTTIVNEFKLTGADTLTTCDITERVEIRPASKQFADGFDRGSVQAFSLRLEAPMTRADSVSGLSVTEMASVTIAVSLPMGTTDLDGLMDFVSSAFGLFVDSIDGTSHEPNTNGLFKIAIGASAW
jgi:hypothetical protein